MNLFYWQDVPMHGNKPWRGSQTFEGHAHSISAGLSVIHPQISIVCSWPQSVNFTILAAVKFWPTVGWWSSNLCIPELLMTDFSSDQESLDELMVKKRWYSDRDDFTVTLQDKPFITDLSSVAVSYIKLITLPSILQLLLSAPFCIPTSLLILKQGVIWLLFHSGFKWLKYLMIFHTDEIWDELATVTDATSWLSHYKNLRSTFLSNIHHSVVNVLFLNRVGSLFLSQKLHSKLINWWCRCGQTWWGLQQSLAFYTHAVYTHKHIGSLFALRQTLKQWVFCLSAAAHSRPRYHRGQWTDHCIAMSNWGEKLC